MKSTTQEKDSAETLWQTYIRLLPYVKDLWRHFLMSLFAMLVVAATGPAFSYLIKPIINDGFVEKNSANMAWIPWAIVGLFILRGAGNYLNDKTSSYMSLSIVQKLRASLFSKLMTLPVSYFSENRRGRILSRMLNDVNGITAAGFNVITVIAKDGFTVIGLLFLLFHLDWKLTLITLVTFPVMALCVRWVSKRMRNLARRNQNINGEITQVLTESVDGMRVIRIFGGRRYEENRLATYQGQMINTVVKQAAAGALGSAVTQLMVASSLAVILHLAATQAAKTGFTAGDFVSFLSAMMMMFEPIKRMTSVMPSLQAGLAAAHSVFSFLDEPDEEDHGTLRLPEKPGDIEFRNVVFRYNGTERNAIDGMNLTIARGTVVALVGESGCGKTTTANLLPRFFTPNSGQILIGGTDVREYTLESLRGQMAYVGQDVVLFNDTVANNIAYGMTNVDRDRIEEAARAANAWRFIEALPQGLDTIIGEQGLNLSGGQRQRLAIARALLKDAPILILDEATSALDTESERLVQAALERLMVNRTTLVIAHRLSTVEAADNIVVMHEGRIIEQGRHNDLLARGGRYAQLYAMQFSDAAQVLHE